MATVSNNRERPLTIAAVYFSGLLVGVSMVLFPSAGPLFTDPNFHNLSSGQFGVLFTPQFLAAILASSSAATLAGRSGMKRVMQFGLLSTFMAMALLTFSAIVIDSSTLAFVILLAATGAMGVGFGFTITALNAYAFDLFPGQEDSAVTAIHILTGTGQVGAALILSLFLGFDAWWGAPLTIAIVIMLMLAFQWQLPLTLTSENSGNNTRLESSESSGALPLRVWLFGIVVFAYGAIEGTFGNWSPLYLESEAGLSAADTALGVSLFWGSLTLGRVLFAVVAIHFNTRPLYYVTPVVVGLVFVALPLVSSTIANYALMIAAGLSISFFFPYSVSIASAENPTRTAAVSGVMVAALQIGVGISAIVIGLASEGTSLSTIFQLSAFYAVLMGAGVVYLGVSVRRQKRADGSALPDMDENLPCLVLPCVQTETKQISGATS